MPDAQLSKKTTIDLAVAISMLVYERAKITDIAKKFNTSAAFVRRELATVAAEKLFASAQTNRLALIAEVPIANQVERLRRIEALYKKRDALGDYEECRRLLAEARTEMFGTAKELMQTQQTQGVQINLNISEYTPKTGDPNGRPIEANVTVVDSASTGENEALPGGSVHNERDAQMGGSPVQEVRQTE